MLASVDMGYGHLRAAAALGDHLGQQVVRVDEPPHAAPWEAREWRQTKATYELLSRLSQTPVVGGPFRGFLQRLTAVDMSGAQPLRNGRGRREMFTGWRVRTQRR
mgnify:CR=1 FL=1